jgi:hypothetical protein
MALPSIPLLFQSRPLSMRRGCTHPLRPPERFSVPRRGWQPHVISARFEPIFYTIHALSAGGAMGGCPNASLAPYSTVELPYGLRTSYTQQSLTRSALASSASASARGSDAAGGASWLSESNGLSWLLCRLEAPRRRRLRVRVSVRQAAMHGRPHEERRRRQGRRWPRRLAKVREASRHGHGPRLHLRV